MMTTPLTLALFGTIGTPELIVIALIGLLVFGKRLPEVGKSVGRGIVEFKKGLAGIETDVQQAGATEAAITEPTQAALPASEIGKMATTERTPGEGSTAQPVGTTSNASA